MLIVFGCNEIGICCGCGVCWIQFESMIDCIDFYVVKFIYEIDVSDVYVVFKVGEEFFVIDVCFDEVWVQGCVFGVVYMYYSEIVVWVFVEIFVDVDVVVYCWSFGCNVGVKGVLEFVKFGYCVWEMIGGFEYWVCEGYFVEDVDGVYWRFVDLLIGIVWVCICV